MLIINLRIFRLIMEIRLSEHFTLDEMTKSVTAIKEHIINAPSQEIIDNLKFLCQNVLEPTRQKIGRPLIVTSGYRSKSLNKAVGGVSTSYHVKGLAADLQISSLEDGRKLCTILNNQSYTDLVLLEHSKTSKWVHVQARKQNPRHKINYDYAV